MQSFWRLPWSAGSFSCPFFYFFLNGFFVPCRTPLPSLASVSDTIKGIGKDVGPAPARLQEEWLTPLLPVAFSVLSYLQEPSYVRGGIPFHWKMVEADPTHFLNLLPEELERSTYVRLRTLFSHSSVHPCCVTSLSHPCGQLSYL